MNTLTLPAPNPVGLGIYITITVGNLLEIKWHIISLISRNQVFLHISRSCGFTTCMNCLVVIVSNIPALLFIFKHLKIFLSEIKEDEERS